MKKRWKIVWFWWVVLLSFLTRGGKDWEIVEGVPEDARLVDWGPHTDWEELVGLVIESASFPEVEITSELWDVVRDEVPVLLLKSRIIPQPLSDVLPDDARVERALTAIEEAVQILRDLREEPRAEGAGEEAR
ncbi:MAG: hypothetical protein UY48_C0002G0020 [Candidatus Gottesmanbacteria bacterium GW2011_GWB1_49_7]|uniref:Uncharacterized protein n=1 Tax=Candidatus Gottesmanbacteria bacterium GW2011_GWB1_49_7 TaxID=1618448 RepID=A0A0G1Z3G3_9BACT|nr:MAG: hypothetical protein UY48_C0002G0020 [Candidatus Gottesmanbacteria bacterium GW2011_GWB1_49_7]